VSVAFTDPFGLKPDSTFVNCRPVGGEGSSGTLGHCAVRVKDAKLKVDATIEMAPDAQGLLDQVHVAGPADRRTLAYTGPWAPVAIPNGMTEQQFDQRVLASAVAVSRDIQGLPYLPFGQVNSNRFVYDVITGAGGIVPGAPSAGFTWVPGICGGSGVARGSHCSP
jgi:hypothetical protein